jgi:surface antigen
MRSIFRYVLLVCFFGVLITQPLYAENLRWLNYSPVKFFTDKDWELAKSAARQALNEAKDGEKVPWSNPETKTHGALTPTSSTTKNGAKCRTLKIENHANNLSGSALYLFCQQNDGKWKAVSAVSGGN